jgi:hypothetical protein
MAVTKATKTTAMGVIRRTSATYEGNKSPGCFRAFVKRITKNNHAYLKLSSRKPKGFLKNGTC